MNEYWSKVLEQVRANRYEKGMKRHRYIVRHKKKHGRIRNWKDLERVVFARDKYKCQKCNVRKDLVVHHIKPQRLCPKRIYDPSNCMTLCPDCHKAEHQAWLNDKALRNEYLEITGSRASGTE